MGEEAETERIPVLISIMGILYIIATPIGNLEDISLRALRILKEVDLIACEDTRTTKKLLAHYNISTPTISCFQHSRLKKLKYILSELKIGKNIALVSESGTPCISDPGIKLITEVLCDDIEIVPVPGPSALIAAASVSGLPAQKFVFMGFPPHKKGRKKYFEDLVSSKYTVIFYESPYRILKSLEELKSLSKQGRKVVVARELTKKFETIYRGTIEEAIEQIKRDRARGEFTVVLQNKRGH